MGLPAADNPSSRAGRRTAIVAAAVALVLLVPAVAGAQTDSRAEREAVRDRQHAVAEQLDVLQASDAEIDAALDELEASIAAQEEAVVAAEAAAAATAAAVREARADLRAARRDVAILEAAIREMAIASYVHPPSADLVQSLQARSLSDAIKQQIYLDARAHRDLDLLALLERAEVAAVEKERTLTAAAEAAEAAVAQADAELVRLESERQRQASFAADLQDRIDAALAEAAVLAELDADLSAKIAAEQAALIERLPPPPPPPAPVGPTPRPVDTASPPAPAPVERPAPAPEADEDDAEDVDDEPADEPSPEPVTRPSTPPPPLRTVQGITVHAEIADAVDALLSAADADGISLSGSGYRSTERQIQLRRANCGPTDYDIWERPASTCSPPTAIPGRSLHEQGRAIDLLFEGRLITSRSNLGFQWLAEHAADYGLFNLPSEPWHWSTTGA